MFSLYYYIDRSVNPSRAEYHISALNNQLPQQRLFKVFTIYHLSGGKKLSIYPHYAEGLKTIVL